MKYIMTSSNGNILRVTGPLCGWFTGHRWNPPTKSVTRSFEVFFDMRPNKRWVNHRSVGHLRRYRSHYDVTVMSYSYCCYWMYDPQKKMSWFPATIQWVHARWDHNATVIMTWSKTYFDSRKCSYKHVKPLLNIVFFNVPGICKHIGGHSYEEV